MAKQRLWVHALVRASVPHKQWMVRHGRLLGSRADTAVKGAGGIALAEALRVRNLRAAAVRSARCPRLLGDQDAVALPQGIYPGCTLAVFWVHATRIKP